VTIDLRDDLGHRLLADSAEPQVYGLVVMAAIAEDWAAEPLVVEQTVRDDVARYAG
jgi:hypothetical protein